MDNLDRSFFFVCDSVSMGLKFVTSMNNETYDYLTRDFFPVIRAPWPIAYSICDMAYAIWHCAYRIAPMADKTYNVQYVLHAAR